MTGGATEVRGFSGNNAIAAAAGDAQSRGEDGQGYAREPIAVTSVKVSRRRSSFRWRRRAPSARRTTRGSTRSPSRWDPDAGSRRCSRGGTIDSHYSSAPFQYKELETPGIHLVLSSFDTMGARIRSARW